MKITSTKGRRIVAEFATIATIYAIVSNLNKT